MIRKSASVLMPSSERNVTLPPSPPSPPSGPPQGTNFSRRKLTAPRPPLPACTRMVASSTNFMGWGARVSPTKNPARAGFFESRLRSAGLLGVDAHEGVFLGTLLRKLHATLLEGEQRVIGADADVRAGAHRRAPLADDDVAGEHGFAAELLHAETFAVRLATFAGTAACLFMCHVWVP